MSDRLDPTFVRAQIELLRISHPGIWDDGDEILLADMLEAQTSLHDFLDAVLDRQLEADGFAEGIDLRIRNIKDRQERFISRVEALRGLAFKVMTAAGLKKLELLEATLSIRAGQPKVIITDEAALPAECIRVRKEPDKIAIKERLARGEPVAGAELSNSEPVLSVRVK